LQTRLFGLGRLDDRVFAVVLLLVLDGWDEVAEATVDTRTPAAKPPLPLEANHPAP
jgi:hypothetical protein